VRRDDPGHRRVAVTRAADADGQAGTAPAADLRAGYAGLVSRLAALAVDVMLLTVAISLGTTLAIAGWKTVIGPPPTPVTAAVAAAAAIAPATYFTVAWWIAGRTAGQVLFGIRVTDNVGLPLHLPRALTRAVVGLALAPVWLVGMVGVLLDGRRRAWHDRLLRTTVRYR
jgi:hypothetical protein